GSAAGSPPRARPPSTLRGGGVRAGSAPVLTQSPAATRPARHAALHPPAGGLPARPAARRPGARGPARPARLGWRPSRDGWRRWDVRAGTSSACPGPWSSLLRLAVHGLVELALKGEHGGDERPPLALDAGHERAILGAQAA